MRLFSKLMTSQTGKQITAIYTNCPNNSRQLIEYNMGNIFIEKSYTRCGGETSPRPFYKKSNFNISPDQQSEILTSSFLFMSIFEVYQNILIPRCRN